MEKIKKSYRFVNLDLRNPQYLQVRGAADPHAVDEKMVVDDLEGARTEIVENLPVERKYAFKSGVNIMFGCNNFCSYCIVPYVRGQGAQPPPGGDHRRRSGSWRRTA